VNKFFTYAIMLNLLIVACVQFVIMLLELKNTKESAKSGIKCFYSKDYHSPVGMNCAKNCGWESYMYIALEINKQTNTLYGKACVLYRNVYTECPGRNV
jgi:hypothetical protein